MPSEAPEANMKIQSLINISSIFDLLGIMIRPQISQYILRPRLSAQVLQMISSAACPVRSILLSLLHALRAKPCSGDGDRFVQDCIRESRHSSFQRPLAELSDEYKKLKSGTTRNSVAVLIATSYHHFHLTASHQHDKRSGECQPY